MDENWIVPFGKYKGRRVEEMLADRDYCEWCAQQPWFRDRFGNVYKFIINNGGEPQDSPEHNKMQARFLDNDFCLRVFRAAYPISFDPRALAERDRWESGKRIEADVVADDPLTVERVRFECAGWDVSILFGGGLRLHHKDGYSWQFGPPPGDGELKVECKPTIGDDYPNVLRQMKRYPLGQYDLRILLVGTYTGEAVPLASVRQIFATAGIRLILESECV